VDRLGVLLRDLWSQIRESVSAGTYGQKLHWGLKKWKKF
jgi:hypothetical protein